MAPVPNSPLLHTLMFSLVSLVILGVNGIVFPLALTPDSYGYLGISEGIARAWRDGGSLFDISQKTRVLGYPALIALFELGFGPRPFLAVYFLHGILVVATGAVLFWTLLRLGVASLVAAALSLLYVAALPTMLASYLLTDTINNALTAIAVCLLALPLFKPDTPALGRVVAAGILIGIAFFFREANQYLVVCLLPIVLVIAWLRGAMVHGIVLLLFFLAPLLLAVEFYKTFNAARFDARFVTTAGRTVMLHAVLPLAKRKPELFDGSSELDKTARVTLREYTFAETLEINSQLLNSGFSEERLAQAAFGKYFEAWRRYPLGMARVVLERLRLDKQATELLNPMAAFYNNARWRSHISVSESKRMRAALRRGDVKELLTVLPVVAGRIPSLTIFVFVLLGSPVVMARAWAQNDRTVALGLAALLASYLGYILVYALVNMEMRYLSGIAVILALSGALTLHHVSQRVRTPDQK